MMINKNPKEVPIKTQLMYYFQQFAKQYSVMKISAEEVSKAFSMIGEMTDKLVADYEGRIIKLKEEIAGLKKKNKKDRKAS